MASDVFAQDNELALQIKDAGRVNSARPGEIALGAAETFGQFEKHRLFYTTRDRAIDRRELLADEFDARLSTQAAARGNRAEAMGGGRSKFCRRGERDVEDVAERGGQRAPRDFAQIVPRAHDSFREKEAGGEFLIVAGRAHGDGERVLADPNLQRLLDRHFIGHAFIAALRFAAHNASGADALRFGLGLMHKASSHPIRTGNSERFLVLLLQNFAQNDREKMPAGNVMTLTAILLAGGESRRMGRDKATIDFRGQPLWQRQIELLRSLHPETIFVSARQRPCWLPLNTELLLDDAPSRGPLSGLTKALERMQTSHLVALAVDMPFMTAEHMQVLWSLAADGCGILPVIGDKAEPLAAIYPQGASADVSAALAGDDFSLQRLCGGLLRGGKLRVFQVAQDDEGLYRSVNERGDFDCSDGL